MIFFIRLFSDCRAMAAEIPLPPSVKHSHIDMGQQKAQKTGETDRNS
jgi:hypothetical protein